MLLLLTVSVSAMDWFDEDKRFAVGFSDGVIGLCSREPIELPWFTQAHEVF